MSDPREALIIDVATAIYDSEGDCRACAINAIDIVLEEAARVAEAKSDEWTAEWRKGLKVDSHLEGMSDGASEIAAALRAYVKP